MSRWRCENDEMTSATRIIGYAEPLIARPGDSVEFKASCEDVDEYQAAIVRFICADPDPSGPGLDYEQTTGGALGPFEGRTQSVPVGSFAKIPGHPALQSEALSVGMMVWPTRPGGRWQSLISRKDDVAGRGFVLGLNERGAVTVCVTVAGGTTREVSAGVSLEPRRWYFVHAHLDAHTGYVALSHTADEPQARQSAHAFSAESFEFQLARDPTAPVMIGACTMADSGHAYAAQHFDGKIDRPLMLSGTVEVEVLRALIGDDQAVLNEPRVLAAWDFARDISGVRIYDRSRHGCHGECVNLPMRGATGFNWDGSTLAWHQAPEQYGAIHFHSDDLYDCLWETDFAFTLPDDARSGFYAARLTAPGAEGWITFFVCPPLGASRAPIAFVASTATFLAYANTRHRMDVGHIEQLYNSLLEIGETEAYLRHRRDLGGSTYETHADGSGVVYSSQRRPILNMRPGPYTFNFINDSYVIAWLERAGYDYDVICDEDLHTDGHEVLRDYRVLITGSHPEYVSTSMWNAIDGFQKEGGRHMYLGGNGFYWRIAYHAELRGVIENRRGFSGVRTWEGEPGEEYLSFTGEPGGLWRSHGRAPQKLVGVGFSSCVFDRSTYYLRTECSFDERAAFIFEGLSDDERLGDFGQRGGGAVGLELDRAEPALGTPAHALVVATSHDVGAGGYLTGEEFITTPPAIDAEQHGHVRADMVFFETCNGGAVFSVGSIAWPTSLLHSGGDNNVSQITRNVLNRFLNREAFE